MVFRGMYIQCTSNIQQSKHEILDTSEHLEIEILIPKNTVKMWDSISTTRELLYTFQDGIQTVKSYKKLLKRFLPLMNLKTNYFQQDGDSIHTVDKVITFNQTIDIIEYG